MNVTFSDEYDYTPIWNNNLKEENPVVFHMRYLTTPEREKFIIRDLASVDGELRQTTRFDNVGILKASVTKIDNLSKNGSPIDTVQKLLAERGFSALSSEVADYAAGQNILPDLKN